MQSPFVPAAQQYQVVSYLAMLQTARCLRDNLLRHRKNHVIWALTRGGVRVSRLQGKNGAQKSLTLLQAKRNVRLERKRVEFFL